MSCENLRTYRYRGEFLTIGVTKTMFLLCNSYHTFSFSMFYALNYRELILLRHVIVLTLASNLEDPDFELRTKNHPFFTRIFFT
jgi:hypothetical protein